MLLFFSYNVSYNSVPEGTGNDFQSGRLCFCVISEWGMIVSLFESKFGHPQRTHAVFPSISILGRKMSIPI